MTKIDGGTGSNNPGSVVTSLRELANLEAARVRDLAEAAERRRERERADAEAEAAARREIAQAEARRLEEEAALRARRDRAEEASRLAQRVAAIEEARIAAEQRGRAEEAARAHAHALELIAAGRTATSRHPRAFALVGAIVILAIGIAAVIATSRSQAREAEALRAHGTDVQANAILEGELRAAKETIARLEVQLGEARDDARTTRAFVERSRRELDALRATCRRGIGPRAPPSPSFPKNEPLGASGCKPGDPLCGTIGAPGR